MKKITYPFQPKSIAYLRQGQFWGFELVEPGFINRPGWYGCGRVLQLVERSRKSFLAGMMDWVGHHPPTAEDLAGCAIVSQIITDIGSIEGFILGFRSLEQDQLEPLIWLGQVGGNGFNPNGRPDLMRGLEVLGEATEEEHQALLADDHRVRAWGGFGVYQQSAAWFEQKIAEQQRNRHG